MWFALVLTIVLLVDTINDAANMNTFPTIDTLLQRARFARSRARVAFPAILYVEPLDSTLRITRVVDGFTESH
jgi:hypothetical protein